MMDGKRGRIMRVVRGRVLEAGGRSASLGTLRPEPCFPPAGDHPHPTAWPRGDRRRGPPDPPPPPDRMLLDRYVNAGRRSSKGATRRRPTLGGTRLNAAHLAASES